MAMHKHCLFCLLCLALLSTPQEVIATSPPVEPPVQLFVIICQQRTGSTTLTNLLDQLPGFRVFGEIFFHSSPSVDTLPGATGRPDIPDIKGWEINQRLLEPRKYLDAVVQHSREEAAAAGLPPVRAVGFKIHSHHLKHDSTKKTFFEEVVKDTGIKVIMLTRYDMVAVALSLEVAKTSSVWHNKPGESQVLEKGTKTVPYHTLMQEVNTHMDWYRHVAATCIEVGKMPHLTEYDVMFSRGPEFMYLALWEMLNFLQGPDAGGITPDKLWTQIERVYCFLRSKQHTQALPVMMDPDNYIESQTSYEEFMQSSVKDECAALSSRLGLPDRQ